MDRLFVTGTDTGVGKTVASAALLHAFRGRGLRAVGMKPVASGCLATPDGWRNDDALALQAASDPVPPYDDLNPYALPAPLAPEIAARDAGMDVQLGVLISAFERLHPLADLVLVEGVGGWAAPLTATLDQRHLAQELRLPVVLVVGMRLGCINHARLSARAIQDDGARLVGWIANEVDPDMERRDENFALLSARMPVPCWGRLPHAPDGDARAMAKHLSVP
ncbi:dethiobiotin synthase [Pseudoxanthomonas sp. PXM02]|uniref:dethiobiotin synthase n=1 Tax=Pseudoxanthomonas sp. PXM02 TaxID=2769294 RepID=UPI001CE1C427|nr:dethiobiotin synthase [Pseudoxanthomonas sp. PXM02]